MASQIESLILDILLRDRASEGLSKAGMAARDAGVSVDSLQHKLTDLGKKTAAARVKLEGDKDAQASLDKIDLKLLSLDRRTSSARITVEGVARATAELAALDVELDKLGRQGGTAGKATAALGAGTGGLSGMAGMGALIGAGVALSPVLATLGTGLAGFGLAAVAVGKPIADAASKTGGLAANMKKLDPEQQAVARGVLDLQKKFGDFQTALKPEVLGAFSTGLHLAGGLLHDIQPVAIATGKAFDTLLTRVDKEFQGKQWQSFFSWMAQQAGPDMQLVGNVLISLLNDLPGLLQDLQPLAVDLLRVADAAAKVIGGVTKLHLTLPLLGAAMGAMVAGPLGALAGALAGAGIEFTQTGQHASDAGVDATRFAGGARTAAIAAAIAKDHVHAAAQATAEAGRSFRDSGLKAVTYAQQLDAARIATKQLMDQQNTALSTQLAYGNSLVTTANDAANLRTALHNSRGEIGLQTQAQRDSFAAANTYIADLANQATQAYKSGHGVDAAIAAIRGGLPVLESAKTHNRQYWTEVRALVGWLNALRAEKAITENIRLIGAGRWVVTSGPDTGQVRALGGHTAKGWLVSGGTPGQDSVPIMAMPGELVVPAGMVQAGLVNHLRGMIPGFAAGGIVGSYAGPAGGLQSWGAGNWAASVTQITAAMVNAVSRAYAAALSGAGGPVSADAAAAQAFARAQLGGYGWAAYWPALLALWNRESGWNRFARNPSSGAYGIPQALPPSKMGPQANPPVSSAGAQIMWGLNYIAGRYGNPGAAWAHELQAGWYDQGGWLPQGASIAVNTTGRPEWVGGGPTYIINIAVSPLAHPADTGRAVVNAIRAFEQRSGTGWRS